MTKKQEKIFKKWLSNYNGVFYKVGRSYANDEDAEDLIQEILLQLYRSIPSFQNKSSEKTWVYRVAINTALTWKRNEKKRKFKTGTLKLENEVAPDSVNRHMTDYLYECINNLAKAERSVVLLNLEGFSYKEAAKILGISESNVGVKLSRAKAKLSEMMKGYKDELR